MILSELFAKEDEELIREMRRLVLSLQNNKIESLDEVERILVNALAKAGFH